MLVLAGQAHQHPGLVNKQATKKVLVLINENWLIPELFVFRDNMKYHHQRDWLKLIIGIDEFTDQPGFLF